MDGSSSLFESARGEDMVRREPMTPGAAAHEETAAEQQELDPALLAALQADQQLQEEPPPFDIDRSCVNVGILSEEQLRRLRETTRHQPDYDLIRDLVEKRIATEEMVMLALMQESGFQQAKIRRSEDIDPEASSGYDLDLLQQSGVLPYHQLGNTLSVAVADERGLLNLPRFEPLEKGAVTPAIVLLSELDGGFKQLREREARLMKGENASEFSGDVISFVELLLHASVSDGVSDIHIELFAKRADIRRRIDGVMQPWPVSGFLMDNYVAIVARIKILAALNISERRLPQDGAITIEHDGRDVDIRVSIIPALFGERVVLRILNKGALDMSIDTLGFGARELELLKHSVDAPQGMVLVTGPTGSGKSTTLYSALNRINRPELNILTAEDPVEYQMEGVGQIQVKEEIGLTFAAILRSFLRQDPDVILVGEIRDRDTVDIAIKAALTGHLVLSTLHTNDAPSTISRLLNIGVPGYMISSSLKLIVAQRLVRKSCSGCRVVDDRVSVQELIRIGFDPVEAEQLKSYRGEGCPRCHGTGFKGRRGVYEVMAITDRIREAIDRQVTTDELREVAHQDGFRTMQALAREMIREGDLSLLEYGRVMLSE